MMSKYSNERLLTARYDNFFRHYKAKNMNVTIEQADTKILQHNKLAIVKQNRISTLTIVKSSQIMKSLAAS